ncbi:hypothetical protein B0H12DRAFT_747242 [Mycena haematopus]|nr:hypothetical protein B0H12DRAFT_747242 [Mycena haematopus]
MSTDAYKPRDEDSPEGCTYLLFSLCLALIVILVDEFYLSRARRLACPRVLAVRRGGHYEGGVVQDLKGWA